MEEWRSVIGYETRYEVSSMGRVRSLWHGGPRPSIRQTPWIMRPTSSDGYLMFGAYSEDGGVRRIKVHIAVLEAFVGPKPDGMETRHINGDRSDNRVENLAWGTHEENERDRERHGMVLRGERNGQARLTDAQAWEALTTTTPGTDLAREFGVKQQTISMLRTGKTWRHLHERLARGLGAP